MSRYDGLFIHAAYEVHFSHLLALNIGHSSRVWHIGGFLFCSVLLFYYQRYH